MEEKNKDILEKSVYYSYIQNSYDFSISPLIVGSERCKRNKGKIKFNKACYVMHYVLAGQGSIKTEQATYEVNPGDFFIFVPHSNVIYEPKRENPWSYIWIEFNGSSVKTMLDATSFSNTNFIFKDDKDETLKNTLVEMIHEDNLSTESSEAILITSYIFKILSFLVRNYPKNENVNITKKEETIKRIERYLNIHYNDTNFSIGNVAEEFSFSQSYITRLFKSQTGITPIQYVDELRMKKAIELLNHHTLTIDQIAENIGYKNQFYFTKRFKRYYGMPPTKYKQKNSVEN